jgi:hypothetical protein
MTAGIGVDSTPAIGYACGERGRRPGYLVRASGNAQGRRGSLAENPGNLSLTRGTHGISRQCMHGVDPVLAGIAT